MSKCILNLLKLVDQVQKKKKFSSLVEINVTFKV